MNDAFEVQGETSSAQTDSNTPADMAQHAYVEPHAEFAEPAEILTDEVLAPADRKSVV